MTSLITTQLGPQTDFLKSRANICIYGGSAGGGKTYGLLLEPLRHINNPLFNGVIFRETSVQVKNPGGLWDESMKLYPLVGGRPSRQSLIWRFPSGATMRFSHLEHVNDVLGWQGSQVPFIAFDELTHFSEATFFYMLSRNRSDSGIPGYIRATCNPDCDSWVRKFIDWWIDKDTGIAIKERAGVLRWFIRIDDRLVWADSREELISLYGADSIPKSATFIPSSLRDNQILMQKDPSYLANLKALSRVERLRLLDGNWNVRPSAGLYFQREYFPMIDTIPLPDVIQKIRYWDRAATKPHEENKDPDWTRGVMLMKLSTGQFLVADVRSAQDSPLAIERMVKNTASQDGVETTIGIEQDPGSAGVADVDNYSRLLAGYIIKICKPTQNKITRAGPVSAQAEAGNILVLRAPWNEDFFRELENFPEGVHDDQIDALSGAFNEMCGSVSMLDYFLRNPG